MALPGRIAMRRPGVPGPRGGGVYVPEFQRTRLLDATLAIVAEGGFRRLTARRVSGRAGVSNKTFYDLFENSEDCFLAAFDDALARITAVIAPAYEGQQRWQEKIRAALLVLLGLFGDEPGLGALVVVDALGAGPRVLARRAECLEALALVVDQGRSVVKPGREPLPLTAEGVVGAVLSVLHQRLLERDGGSLVGLCNPLMGIIVLPYLGPAAARKELARPLPRARRAPADMRRSPLEDLDVRITLRTLRVLAAVAELGVGGVGPSNRQVADIAGVADQGQISKLLARLEGMGLLQNTRGEIHGLPYAWQLTPRGREVLRACHTQEFIPATEGREV